MLENLKKQNLLVRVLIFYGLQFVYSRMRLSMHPEIRIISQYPTLFIIIDITTFLIFAVYLVKTFQLPVKSPFFSLKSLGWLLLGATLLLALQNSVNLLPSDFFPYDSNAGAAGAFVAQFPFAGFFFGCVMAPVIEESIYRGLFFQLFFQKAAKWRPFLLILVSGLIFGSIHVLGGGIAWQNLLFYSMMGWIFGTVYYFNRDLKVNILLHFANNAAVQFIPVVFHLFINFHS